MVTSAYIEEVLVRLCRLIFREAESSRVFLLEGGTLPKMGVSLAQMCFAVDG